MARAESKMIMGYLPIEQRHYPALLSLVTPATPAVKLLDPFAGEGAFLEAAAQAWNATPYANELDGERAAQCIERFGPKQAVRCDVERLLASNGAFGAGWFNPPYDHDKAAKASKRIEFAYLRHSWKWLQDGGLALWCVYLHHLTEEAATFLAKNSRSVDVWALPGKHLGEYDQIVVAAIKGTPPDVEALYDHILAQKAAPHPLTAQPEPVYKLPLPPAITRFVFAPDMVDEVQGLRLVEEGGAWKSHGFQALLDVPPVQDTIRPVVAPRPGHLALVLAAGVADGAVIDTSEYGQVALCGKTEPVEQVARVDVEAMPGDPDRQVKKTTIRLKPSTTLTLLAADGTLVEMDGDEALLNFITANKQALAGYLNRRFDPMYRFDFHGLSSFLDHIRLNGKYPLYTAQKHVVAAVARGLEERDSLLLVGQMGVGKTAIGGAASIAITSGIVESLRSKMQDDQVVLVVAPPHLVDKWKRELLSIHPNIIVEQLDRHEDVKAFMDRAARLGPGIAKIGLIKRDMTKLGAGHEPAVVWREQRTPLWWYGEPVPDGYTPDQRIRRDTVPTCPHCGSTVMQEKKGSVSPASESWLKSSQRTCTVCQGPLWQEARDRGSRPKPGQKYPAKNPRYRLDEYLRRRYPDRIYLLVWDEVHEAQHGDTGNGESFGRLAGLAQKVLAMTGTPFNGRSSSLFNLEYHLNPRVRQRYPWGGAARLSRKTHGDHDYQAVLEENTRQRGRAESRWVADMGVREQVIEERPSYDRDTGVYTGTTTYERPYEEAPGISPLLVAEVLDHAIFFSLGDLGKALPQFEEIAVPVVLDPDVYDQYERTRQMLKDYLIQRRWEGDTTFRGAYLQWAMGWPNAAHRPYEVIHNLKHPVTGMKIPHRVTSLPSYGEQRVYAKEAALLDLLRDELATNRPCVVYLRQTATRDIQPRLESLIRQHVPGAKPFILKNTVEAERREAVINAEVAKGTNVILSNPELVKTGLDLVFAPTLIFFELVFNLSTLMQAAARSYRLNQTHPHCKVYYLYAEDTMEATAVQLMSRKQRAAKLLTGDTGLTGLDALTEGEGGFEEALLDAIGRDQTLLDPSVLFKAQAAQSEVDAEDAAFWNVEVGPERAPLPVAAAALEADPLVQAAIALGGVVEEEPIAPRQVDRPRPVTHQPARRLERVVGSYFATVHILPHTRSTRLQAELLRALTEGVPGVPGLSDATFDRSAHEESLVGWTRGWLEQHRVVFAGHEAEVAARLVSLARGALTSPDSPDAAALHEGSETYDEQPAAVSYDTMPLWRPEAASSPIEPVRSRRRVRQGETAVQLALF